MIAREDQLALAAAANRAPSVHNIQPARFRFDDERTITLLEDSSRRLHVGDPQGKDNQKSLGAALEGLVLALSERGVAADVSPTHDGAAKVVLTKGADIDALAPFAESRASYRGAFAPAAREDSSALARLVEACPDLHIITAPGRIAELARFYDQMSLEVVRDSAYRTELLSWMRLSREGPDFWRDGLNAEHLALSPFEAFAAGIVLGNAFGTLDAVGLAGPLMSESSRVKSAACLAFFHRPASEPEIGTGRRFYRVWLEIERLGMSLCPMSVLADVPRSAARLLSEAGLGPDRKLVTVFRIGRRPKGVRTIPRSRLPATEIIVLATD